jgi:hypothetical protein
MRFVGCSVLAIYQNSANRSKKSKVKERKMVKASKFIYGTIRKTFISRRGA